MYLCRLFVGPLTGFLTIRGGRARGFGVRHVFRGDSLPAEPSTIQVLIKQICAGPVPVIFRPKIPAAEKVGRDSSLVAMAVDRSKLLTLFF